MRKIRNEKSEMPGNFSNYINMWSLESVATIAVEKRLHILDGTSKDEKAAELINCIRNFFEQVVEFEGKPSIWRYYETKAFKELMNVFDEMTK